MSPLAAARPGLRKNGAAAFTGPSEVATSGANNGAGASSFNVAIPAGASVGNLLILTVHHRTSTGPSTPIGWALLLESMPSTGARPTMQTAFYRWCQPGDAGTNVSVGFGGSNVSCAQISAWSGADETYPISTAVHNAGNGTSFSGLAPYLPQDQTAVLHSFGVKASSGTDTGAVAFGAGVIQDRLDYNGPSSENTAILGHESRVTAGVGTARSITAANTSDIDAVSIGITKSGATPSTSAYDTEVLADSPLGYWKLGESSGTQMTDSSGNARHGTYASLPGTSTPLVNSTGRDSALFTSGGSANGTVSYGSWMDQASLDIEFWYQDTGGGVLGTCVGRLDPGDGVAVWGVRARSGGSFCVDYYSAAGGIGGPSGGGPSAIGGPVQPVDGDRLHVVISHVGTSFKMYVNGALVSDDAGPSGYWSGGSGHGGLRIYDSFAHKMSHVAIYPGGTLTPARVQAHYGAAMASASFKDGFNRSNRDLRNDNGWLDSQVSNASGLIEINGNKIRGTSGVSGFPGSGSNTGSGLRQRIKHSNGNIAILEFDVVTGATINNYVQIVMAGTVTGSPAIINTGVLFRMYVGSANNWIIQKITGATSTVDHTPGTSPAILVNATTRIKMVLNRSAGQLFIYKDGTLQYTSAAGDFSGLTGSNIYAQFAASYAGANIELDNLLAV